MSNIYRDVQVAVRQQILKYVDTLDCGIQPNQVVADNINKTLPSYPFITLDIIDDDDSNNLPTMADVFNLDIQIKAVDEDENRAKSIGRWLRKLLFLQRPFYDLTQQNIAPQDAKAIPSTVSPIINDFQFQSGAIITLQVLDPINDKTQAGALDHVDANYNLKEDK